MRLGSAETVVATGSERTPGAGQHWTHQLRRRRSWSSVEDTAKTAQTLAEKQGTKSVFSCGSHPCLCACGLKAQRRAGSKSNVNRWYPEWEDEQVWNNAFMHVVIRCTDREHRDTPQRWE